MYELLLITIVSASSAGASAIETQAIETYDTADACLDAVSQMPIRKIQLPTGQTLTLKLACEKRP